MEKKLYRVKVDLFVMAENGSDACAAATQARFDIFECTARKADIVPLDWQAAVPFNADDERTCLEILGNPAQNASPETHLMKLPAYVEAAIRVFDNNNQSIQPGGQTG